MRTPESGSQKTNSAEWKTPEISIPVSIQERVQLAPRITLIRFNESLKMAKPGQYLMLWIPRFDEKPFMISQSSPLEIIVQARGPFTTKITDPNFSEKLFIRGPLGTSFSLPKNKTDISTIVIDNTAGLSTAMFLLHTLVTKEKSKIRLFLNEEFFSILPPDVLGYFPYQTYSDVQLLEVLQMILTSPTKYVYFSNTSEKVIQQIKTAKKMKQLPLISAQGLFVNHYIACSMGVCGRCAEDGFLAGKLPCREGPVFDVLKLK